MSEELSLGVAFNGYQMKLGEMTAYLGAMTPHISKERSNIELFVKGTIVMVVAHYEEFLQGLLTSVVATRPDMVREHFKTGSATEQRLAENTSRKNLASLVQARVSFQRSGASIDRTFQAFFGCPAWPDDATRSQIVEFVVIRNVIVHAWGAAIGEGDDQPHIARHENRHVFSSRSYGEFRVYTLDPVVALKPCLIDTMRALEKQFNYLKSRLRPVC